MGIHSDRVAAFSRKSCGEYSDSTGLNRVLSGGKYISVHLDRFDLAAPCRTVGERQPNRLSDSVIAAVSQQLLRLSGSVLNLKLHIINGDVM
ncbi:hypothetical protein D3C80_1219040 [compost metagenome]